MNAIASQPRQSTGMFIDAEDMTAEYQLRSATGRTVMSFTDRDRAIEQGHLRQLNVFRVVTISEQISGENPRGN